MTIAVLLSPAIDAVLSVAAIVAALAVILRPVRGAASFILKLRDEWEDIEKRLDSLEELRPNHGSSIYDKVGALRKHQDEILSEQQRISELVHHMARFFDGALPDELLVIKPEISPERPS